MNQKFKKCLDMLLEHEGGFVDHPDDPGGMTNLGVTRATLEQYRGGHVTEDEMRSLTPKDVEPIYYSEYAKKVRFDDLPDGLNWAVFDWAVNSGSGRPAKALQRIIGCKADGAIGPKTLQAVEKHDVAELIEKLHDSRQEFYESLRHFETFGKGWTRRNKETREQALRMAV